MMTFQQMIVSQYLLSYAAVDSHYPSLVTIYCHLFLVTNISSQPSWVAIVSHSVFFAGIVCPGPILLVSVSCHAILVVILWHRTFLVVIFYNQAFSVVIVPHGSSLEGIVLHHFSFEVNNSPLSDLVTLLSLGSLHLIH